MQSPHQMTVGALPSLSKSPLIRDVWADNLEEEFEKIRSFIPNYPFVAMDTEFPGVVAKPVGTFKTTHEFYYQTLRCNVNMLKIIQLGITLLNEKGEVPAGGCTWQFNFRFSLQEDIYAQDSIELLKNGGINFEYFATKGIDMMHFAEMILASGLVINPDITWLAFHAGYDFGYLTKVISARELPEMEDEFTQLLHIYFPRLYDIKYMLRHSEISHSIGLDVLADMVGVRRFGTAHQAGSDSLLTGHSFFKLLRDRLSGNIPSSCNGVLYGLSEDSAAAALAQVTPSYGSSPSQYTGVAPGASAFPATPNTPQTPANILVMHGGSRDAKIHQSTK